jgi:hypothetical protein
MKFTNVAEANTNTNTRQDIRARNEPYDAKTSAAPQNLDSQLTS